MNRLKYLLLITLALLLSGHVNAKKTTTPKLYMFGMAAAFTDTIVHFTQIQEIDSAWIESKNKFLLSRDNYSYQLRDFLGNTMQMSHRTCIVFYNQNKKKLDKKYIKMKRLYTNPKKKSAQHYDVRFIDSQAFHFQTIDESIYFEDDPISDKSKTKKDKKSKKRGK